VCGRAHPYIISSKPVDLIDNSGVGAGSADPRLWCHALGTAAAATLRAAGSKLSCGDDFEQAPGIQTQAYSTSLLQTLRKWLNKLATAGDEVGSTMINPTERCRRHRRSNTAAYELPEMSPLVPAVDVVAQHEAMRWHPRL
jgi:hypothetical protein